MKRREFVIGAAVAGAGAALGGRPTSASAALSTVPAGMTRRTLPSGRTYLIRPRVAATPGPLAIGLHGTARDAAYCNDTFWVTFDPATTGWSRHAASRDYTLVLGEALAGKWNVGGGWPGGTQDDDQYLLDVTADVTSGAANVDAAQVFVAGFSAGGAMAWRMAAQHPGVFAAAGSASGWAPLYPARPIDSWHYHGTADTTVPIHGGTVNGFTFPSAHLEAERAPRGSRVVLYATSGGHGTPGWMAGTLYGFWTATRLRP